tara:strand:+ start:952 stop:1194 length:243 start_codon:yes stop_codon:yes gene_type:complete
METLIVGVIIAIVLLIAAPYLVWSAIILIPRIFWACSKVMTCLILLGIFGYGVNMLIEHNAAKMGREIENAPRATIIEEN